MCSSPRTRHWYSPPRVEHAGQHGSVENAAWVRSNALLHHFEQPDATDVAGGTTEVTVNQFPAQSDRFEDLRTAVRHVRAMPIFDMTLSGPCRSP